MIISKIPVHLHLGTASQLNQPETHGIHYSMVDWPEPELALSNIRAILERCLAIDVVPAGLKNGVVYRISDTTPASIHLCSGFSSRVRQYTLADADYLIHMGINPIRHFFEKNFSAWYISGQMFVNFNLDVHEMYNMRGLTKEFRDYLDTVNNNGN